MDIPIGHVFEVTRGKGQPYENVQLWVRTSLTKALRLEYASTDDFGWTNDTYESHFPSGEEEKIDHGFACEEVRSLVQKGLGDNYVFKTI